MAYNQLKGRLSSGHRPPYKQMARVEAWLVNRLMPLTGFLCITGFFFFLTVASAALNVSELFRTNLASS